MLTTKITNIADSIRNKTGKKNKITLDEMPNEINSIKTEPNLQDKTIEITENGTTVISPDEGYDGLNNLEVVTKVPNSGNTESEIVEITVDLNTLNKTNISVKQDGTTASYGGWYLYKTIDVENIESVKFSNVPCFLSDGLYLYGIVFYDENNNFVSGIGTNEVNADESVKINNIPSACEYLLSSTKDIPEGAKYMDVCSYTINGVNYEPNVILVEVNNVSEVVLQDKVIEINDEYILDITPDEGFDGLGTVSIKVNVNNPINKYQMVEYIKGTSNNEGANHFLTGIYPTNKTSVEVQYSFYKNNNNYSNLFASSRQMLVQTTTANDTRLIQLWNNEVGNGMGTLNNFNKHIVKQDRNKTYFDGVLVHTFTDAEWTDENELKLFGCTGGHDCSGILYYCKIWEDDVLVRDFVPCYRKTDVSIGIYDKVENKFYENAGTVAFEKGSDITA